MIRSHLARLTRSSLLVSKSTGAALLIGLLALSGCDDHGVPLPTLQSIEITPANASVAADTSTQLTATAIYSDNSHADVTTQVAWSSSNPAIATVGTSTGKITAISAGAVSLSAKLQGHSASTALTVTDATLLSIAITPAAPAVALGTTQQFTATGTYSDNSTQNLTTQVTWDSATTSVAMFSNVAGSNGLASSVTAGTSSVTAVMGQVTSAPVTLTVSAATLLSLVVTPPTPRIALGTTQQLTATGTYSDNSTQNLTTQVTWASATSSVATISNIAGSNGLASSATAGTSSVTAAMGHVTSAAITLTASPATLVSIAVSSIRAKIALGITRPLTAIGTYTDDSTQDLTNTATWQSSAPSNLIISNAAGSQGQATGLATGPASASASMGTVTSPSLPLSVTIALYAYASNVTGSTVSQYTVGADGTLSAMTPATVAAGSYPYRLSVDPTGRYAYVANAGDSTVSQYTIGPGGALSAMTPATAATGNTPYSVIVDPTGRYVYVANASDSTVSQYTIGPSGALSAMAPATVGTGNAPFAVTVDPTGRYAYVANTGDSTVSQYTIGPGGALGVMTPASIGAGTNPYSVVIDPTGEYAYVPNSGDNTVSQYTVGPGGALSVMTPASIGAGSGPYSVTVDPTGRYAYVANINDTTVSQYSVGPGGALSALAPATVIAGGNTDCVAIDPTGRYAYVSNAAAANNIWQYDVGAGGALSAMTPPTLTAGTYPYSIVATD